MDVLPAVTNILIAAVAVAFVTYITRSQYKDLKQDIRDLRAEVRSEMGSLRSDLTQVALAVGAQPRPQTG